MNSVYKHHTPQTIHAEVDAVSRLPINKNNRTKKVDIIVFRTNKKGDTILMSKSCENCKNTIKKSKRLKNQCIVQSRYDRINRLGKVKKC